ncbi:MAG TPA: YkgJ family cysteine cluster protein [Pyrinomonadaceae bacterium]|jgi:hypothetical protein|nr:YkgJ family cysteine cluster protein [Pyrinomonadaceae bacterium]
MVKTIKDEQPRTYFDCTKCPAFCCSIYDRVQVTKRDINRLAKHFGVSYETARRRYTKQWQDERVLKRVKDVIFPETCMFLDQETRGCTIYHARPGVCREYPARSRCVYYDVLQFERKQQDDETVVPVVQITYHEVKKKTVKDKGGETEKVWEWEPEKPVNGR